MQSSGVPFPPEYNGGIGDMDVENLPSSYPLLICEKVTLSHSPHTVRAYTAIGKELY